jgi:stage II sporulation protein D
MNWKREEVNSRSYRSNNVRKSLQRKNPPKIVHRRKLLIAALGIIGILVLFIFIIQKEEKDSGFSLEYINADEIPGFMQFTYYNSDEWKAKLGNDFKGRLTYQNLADLLGMLDIKKYVKYEEKSSGKSVKREVWNDIYAQIVDLLDTTGKVKKETVILVKQDTNSTGSLITWQKNGQLHYGFDTKLKQYITYQMYLMDSQVLGITGESKEQAILPDVFITSMDKNIEFLYAMGKYSVPIESSDKINNTVCDLYFQSGKITKIQKKADTVEGKLLTLEDKKIEIEGYGVIDRVENLPVYKMYGTIEEKSFSDIVLGNMNMSYIVADKKVCAILLKEPAEIKTVRVLLLGADQSPYRQDVYLSSDTPYQVNCGDKTETKDANAIVKASDYLTDNTDTSLKLQSPNAGKLYFCDENGKKKSCAYDGIFEVRKYDQGYAVVNALPMEEYLYGVVPSEMPATYPQEALKVQAVCARSYAYIQLMKGAYASLGAHIDDSTNYQVYNLQEHNDSTNKAVDDTCGQVIAYQGNVVEAYYYSTSCGHSGTYQSWNLPSDGSHDYLTGSWLKDNPGDVNLADEAQFDAYITKPDDSCYDSFGKYFRWKATLSIADKSSAVRDKINARKTTKPENIQIHQNGINGEVANADNLGDMTSFATGARSSGGGILKLTVNFKNGTVDILDEYSMRLVLGVLKQNVTLNDGSDGNQMAALPSSYFAITSSDNGNYELSGGGYGHGIGMCQNGAKGMADAGANYQDILKRFYQNIEIKDCYAKQ